MLVKNKNGREIEVTVGGTTDVGILDAEFTDGSTAHVPDDDIHYIMNKYSDELYLAWIENKTAQADFREDR